MPTNAAGERITFSDHKEKTAEDCEAIAGILTELAATVRQGNLRAFESFWIEGGTEEGDAKIDQMREMIVLRYLHREEEVESKAERTK